MALGAPADTGAELALLTAGVPALPAPLAADAGAAEAVIAAVGLGLAAAFSAAELRELLDMERATALLAMHHEEAAAAAEAN